MRFFNVSAQAGSECALEEMLVVLLRSGVMPGFVLVNYRVGCVSLELLRKYKHLGRFSGDWLLRVPEFIGPIKAEVEKWDTLLTLFAFTLDQWFGDNVKEAGYILRYFLCSDIQRRLLMRLVCFLRLIDLGKIR
jgi:hypothetical protein